MAQGHPVPVRLTDDATLGASIHAVPGKRSAQLPLYPTQADPRQTKTDRNQTTVGAGA